MENKEIVVYTPEQVATITQQNIETVYKHMRTGKLNATKLGRNWRITHDNLDKYLKGE